jgi:hypothetical protein
MAAGEGTVARRSLPLAYYRSLYCDRPAVGGDVGSTQMGPGPIRTTAP